MPLYIDITEPIMLLFFLLLYALLIIIGKEFKRSYVTLVALVISLLMLIIHGAQLFTLKLEFEELRSTFARCITIDFIFVLLTYLSYMWVDDIESKYRNKKNIDNNLDWFWKK